MGVINILPRFIHELPGNEEDEFVYTSDAKYSLGTNIHRIVSSYNKCQQIQVLRENV